MGSSSNQESVTNKTPPVSQISQQHEALNRINNNNKKKIAYEWIQPLCVNISGQNKYECMPLASVTRENSFMVHTKFLIPIPGRLRRTNNK